MIDFRLSIKNPFKHSEWRDLYQGEWLITKNKVFEIGFFNYRYNLFEFHLDLNWFGSDHAGPELNLNILGYEVRIALHDTRHWNHEENKWHIYENGTHTNE
jgi:hypothetical protein